MVTWLSAYMDAVLKKFREKNKEIELYKRTVEHDTKEIKLLTEEIDQKDEEILWLGQEKEWLLTNLCKDWDQDAHGTEKEDLRGFITNLMHQALKEGE